MGLVQAGETTRSFSREFMRVSGLGAPSNVHRVAQALLARDLIDRSESTFFITDRFFKRWLQRHFSG
jgi:hypothetical protein